MKTRIVKKLDRACNSLVVAADVLYSVKEDLVGEDIVMVSRNQSLQDIVKEMCGDVQFLRTSLDFTLSVLKS